MLYATSPSVGSATVSMALPSVSSSSLCSCCQRVYGVGPCPARSHVQKLTRFTPPFALKKIAKNREKCPFLLHFLASHHVGNSLVPAAQEHGAYCPRYCAFCARTRRLLRENTLVEASSEPSHVSGSLPHFGCCLGWLYAYLPGLTAP